jgi:AcrR family transcriptional regulator
MSDIMSPRKAEASQQIKEARRAALVRAALKVFARNGLTATRISDITSEAGVSQGLFYHYFPDKEALFTTIVEGAIQETAALTASALASPGSAWHRLHHLCVQMLTGVSESPEFPLVMLQAFTSEAVPAGTRSAIERYGQQTFQDIVALIREWQAESEGDTSDPVELGLAFTACIQGIALSRLQNKVGETPVPRAETILRLFRA